MGLFENLANLLSLLVLDVDILNQCAELLLFLDCFSERLMAVCFLPSFSCLQ